MRIKPPNHGKAVSKLGGVDNMKELFQDIYIDSIMTFLRQINLFSKI